MAGIVVAAQRVITNTLAGRCCMDKLTATYINTNVSDLGTAGGLREEDQIADLQLRLLDLHGIGILIGRGTSQIYAKMIEDILDVTGTVKTTGCVAAVNIFTA